MDIWEYYSLLINPNEQGGWASQGSDGRNMVGQTTSDLLNQIGQGGWELVSLVPNRYGRSNWGNYTQSTDIMRRNTYEVNSWAIEWTVIEYRAFFKRKRP